MCRLLGTITETPAPISALLTPAEIAEFRDLGRFHNHGWGSSWVTPDGDLASAKTVTPACDDPEFPRRFDDVTSPIHVVHLRWASTGMAQVRNNCHPFTMAGITLAHNGYIAPSEDLESLLTPSTVARLEGTTDSERYLALIAQNTLSGMSFSDSVRDAILTLSDRYPRSCLNAIISDGHSLIVPNINRRAESPIDAGGYDDEGRKAPESHRDSYFPLRSRTTDMGVVISSTGISSEGWEPLTEESITEFRREGGTIVSENLLVLSNA